MELSIKQRKTPAPPTQPTQPAVDLNALHEQGLLKKSNVTQRNGTVFIVCGVDKPEGSQPWVLWLLDKVCGNRGIRAYTYYDDGTRANLPKCEPHPQDIINIILPAI